MQTALPPGMHPAIPELAVYLVGGFGNGTRIDYGSGHELNFFAWLAGIAMLGGFSSEDYQAVVLRIFVRYLELARKIQRRYTLEPAGSHGVWGLDDYQFLPYVWGSAQLIGKPALQDFSLSLITEFTLFVQKDHPRLKPRSILQKETVDAMASDYMYFRCIQYIHGVRAIVHTNQNERAVSLTMQRWNVDHFSSIRQCYMTFQAYPHGTKWTLVWRKCTLQKFWRKYPLYSTFYLDTYFHLNKSFDNGLPWQPIVATSNSPLSFYSYWAHIHHRII